MPPPMTSRRFGTPPSSSAPVESMTRGSLGMNGSLMASEPAAMMHCSKRIFWLLPSAPVTSMTCGLANLPTPVTTSTLRCFASTDRPPTSFLTTLFFQLEQLGQVDFRLPVFDTVMAHLTDFVDDLGGVQQRLGWNAADVQANAAQHGPAFDQRDLESEIGSAERGGVATGPGAEH